MEGGYIAEQSTRPNTLAVGGGRYPAARRRRRSRMATATMTATVASCDCPECDRACGHYGLRATPP